MVEIGREWWAKCGKCGMNLGERPGLCYKWKVFWGVCCTEGTFARVVIISLLNSPSNFTVAHLVKTLTMANAEHLKILNEGVEVWNRWRRENRSEKPDLTDTDLGNVDLRIINLVGANLHGSNLQGADLRHANMHNAILTMTNLRSTIMRNAVLSNARLGFAKMNGADLTAASLDSADLRVANLTAANLSRANLRGANLKSVILKQGKLYNTVIGDTALGLADLSDCEGLETVEVNSPCIIDFHTLRASKNLPKSFLLKLGLPELYIDYLPDFYQNEGIRLYPAFLSHSWANKPFARKLYEALIAKGVNVFFDEKKIKPGDEMFTALGRGIEHYDKTILVCSEASLSSWWVDHELEMVFDKERALQKEIGEKFGLLIPITIDDHIFKWTDGKRMAIEKRNIGDFRNWEDEGAFEKALEGLMVALNVDRPDVKPVSHLPRKGKS